MTENLATGTTITYCKWINADFQMITINNDHIHT